VNSTEPGVTPESLEQFEGGLGRPQLPGGQRPRQGNLGRNMEREILGEFRTTSNDEQATSRKAQVFSVYKTEGVEDKRKKDVGFTQG